MNLRPSGYEPDELPGCSTPRMSVWTREQRRGSVQAMCRCPFGFAGRVGLAGEHAPWRPGGDLLSHVLGRSTIGAGAFHGRVRNGIGCGHPAMTTRSPRRTRPRPSLGGGQTHGTRLRGRLHLDTAGGEAPDGLAAAHGAGHAKADQADRGISTGQLQALPPVHTRPIDVMVCHASQGNARLEEGFPLRCFQRLSRPHLATRRCRWRDNRYTRGASIPVLSYWGQRLATFLHPRQIGTELSHDVLNPAHVPL